MFLSELLSDVCVTGITDLCDTSTHICVNGIASDCSRVMPGNVFICISGSRTDGHLYAVDAVRRGASCIIAERPVPVGVPVVIVDSTRSAAAHVWNRWYCYPAENMHVTAVTGTNGKTSVTYFVREILAGVHKHVGLIGTVKCMAGDDTLSFGGGSEIAGMAAAMTTPDPEYLYGALHEMRRRGVTHVVMEASSHALSQRKLDPISADIAVFTGLSPEHLDFHGTMKDYLLAKSVLFRDARRSIINADDFYAPMLQREVPGEYIKVGTDPARVREYDFFAGDVRYSTGAVTYTLFCDAGKYEIKCPMPGRFGLYNSALAVSAAMSTGVGGNEAAEALKNFGGVPGRMETISTVGGVHIMRDFAHTPEAMKGALEIAKGETSGRLWVLFGCGGDRDRTKRPVMGRIASEMADHTVVTSDNCRSENRETIINDIMSGFDVKRVHTIIPDRAEAIRFAVMMADEGDTVLLCGKGHENYEICADGMRPFDEVAIVRSAVSERFGDVLN